MRRRAADPFARPTGFFDLRRDLESPGCAVCRGENRTAWRYLDSLLWEYVTDAGVRWHLRSSHGFCRDHSFMAVAVAADQAGQLGMAILVEDFLAHVLGHINAAGSASRTRPFILRRRGARADPRFEPDRSCPACDGASRIAALYLGLLASEAPESEIGVAAMSELPSLCLPHLRLGLRLHDGEATRARLSELYTAGAELVRRDVQEFIRKRDWQSREEITTPEEGRAWSTGVRVLVGEPWRRPRPR